MLRANGHAVLGKPRDQEVVRCKRGRGPPPLLRLRRLPSSRHHPVGERRAVEDDDDALTDGDLLPRAADEPAPRRSREIVLLVSDAAGSGRDRDERPRHREGREQAQLRGFTPP
jgi:hypothetical protein